MASGHLHFLGIAGHAMRGLALSAKGLGYTVSGTDEGAVPPGSTWLDEHGIIWWRQADPAHLEGVDRLITSGHSPADHPEITEAQRRGLPVLSFAQLVDELLGEQTRIVVSGTHGKTTTAALITWVLETAGLKPSYLIGAPVLNLPSTTRMVKSKYAVLEGDEYRASQLDARPKFSYYRPSYLLITSIEMDHPDLFKDIEEVSSRFNDLAKSMQREQTILYNLKDGRAARIAANSAARDLSYGPSGDYTAEAIDLTTDGLSFSVNKKGADIGKFQVGLYGQHNVDNSLAAVALAYELGIEVDKIQKALATFRGTYRRFSITESQAGFRIVDDYAHHPTAVATTIKAVKQHFGGRCIAIFQPHTFSRTRTLAAEFKAALALADETYVFDIEAAREKGSQGNFSSNALANGKNVVYEPDMDKVSQKILKTADKDATVLIMSVGNQDELIRKLTNR